MIKVLESTLAKENNKLIRKCIIDHLIKLTEKRALPEMLFENLLKTVVLERLIALHQEECQNENTS